jgi:hypothetical protein
MATRIETILNVIAGLLMAIAMILLFGIMVIGCPVTPHKVYIEGGNIHTR